MPRCCNCENMKKWGKALPYLQFPAMNSLEMRVLEINAHRKDRGYHEIKEKMRTDTDIPECLHYQETQFVTEM